MITGREHMVVETGYTPPHDRLLGICLGLSEGAIPRVACSTSV